MDVLIARREAKNTGFDLFLDRLQPRDDSPRLAARDNALSPEHFRVGDAAGDVMRVEPPIHVDGRSESLHGTGRRAGEAPAPEFSLPSHRASCRILGVYTLMSENSSLTFYAADRGDKNVTAPRRQAGQVTVERLVIPSECEGS